MSLLDLLQPQTDRAAASATSSALDQAASRPFNVILQVEQGTQIWIAGLLLAAAVFRLLKK